ncbi:MAG: ribulose-phosphate 3-epimerase [Bacteroidales bacterium]
MKLSASMMCANFLNLGEDIKQLEMSNVEYLHIDVMDGDFVPNFQLGTDYVKALRRASKIPIDIHMMVNNPENHIESFDLHPGDIMSVHQETTKHLQRTLTLINEKGAMAAVALNPATPINTFDYVLDDIGMVLIMSVNPGFAGQKLVPQTIQKIADTRKYLDDKGYPNIIIEVDGNCSFENVPKMSKAGADIFVVGSSSVFSKNYSIADAVNKLRMCVTA